MIKLTFPDGNVREFSVGISGSEIAASISKSLSKNALAIFVDDKLQDLTESIESDAFIRILTLNDEEALDLLRHDAAHILAQAVKELYPSAQITIGPSVQNGFYYDIAYDVGFSEHDLETIEKKMREITARNDKFMREIWNRDDAVKFFKSCGEHYKAEIISAIAEDVDISLYRQGDFIDLCRGPHSPSTGYVKYYKLMKVAGAYWRGDSKNPMLQRIYGTAWATQEQLDNYLFMLAEAEKRDHRKLGRDLHLFHIQDEAQGMIFWHDKGWTIYRTIEQYIRKKLQQSDYIEVKTPILLDRSLWEASGHWEKFGQNMFTSSADEKTLALKPMNCPCHVQIFNQGIRSYRDLPLRMAEFGACHRYEPSGALHGLMRVRGFVQDDAHIFCASEDVTSETVKFCALLREVYADFGFYDIKIKFSDRPEVRAGSDEVWDRAESALRDAVVVTGLEYTVNSGEGAFYGPKLEFVLRDAIGRDWQCGTLQVDCVLPDRLNAHFINNHGEREQPVMLHRAIIGSFERFIGILIEQYAGKFPIWLSPVQVAIATVTTDLIDYATEVRQKLFDAGVRVIIDNSNEKINYKIRNLSLQKIPLLAIIGKAEAENKTVSVRMLGAADNTKMSIEELIQFVLRENK